MDFLPLCCGQAVAWHCRPSASRRPIGSRRIFDFLFADVLTEIECLPARFNELAFCNQRSNLATHCELVRGIPFAGFGLDPRELEENVALSSFDLFTSLNDGLDHLFGKRGNSINDLLCKAAS